ncbi:NAD(P)H nitroreductase [Salinimonas chungwhensis]|uniref:NAD(P)H nitroreductase n=1 Tax=Salinimonas chungwhensis TaxID=265425 RepID=UPI0003641660|nr:NAD(P)H nitroreductase [Salinimonas chungwhensis]
MDALSLLTTRRSQPRVGEPAPGGEVLENIKQAALRAPDHAALAPWQFIVCEGEGLNRLGAIFEQSAIRNGKPQKDIDRASQLPLRAPMIIITIANYTEHPKVPRVEQIASASCAVMAMQMAAIAQGFNGIWRTGAYAQCDYVKEQLGMTKEDELVGFLYLGTPLMNAPQAPRRDTDKHFTHWY